MLNNVYTWEIEWSFELQIQTKTEQLNVIGQLNKKKIKIFVFCSKILYYNC